MARGGRSLHSVGRRANSRRRLLIARSTPFSNDGAPALRTSRPAADPTPPLAGEVTETSAGLAAVSHLLGSAQPATWVFTGDSITHGALFTEGWRSFPELFAERVRWELRRFQDVVINTGVCGDRSADLLANLKARLLRFRPDVALVMIGMNDALAGADGRDEFRSNLAEIVGRLREADVIPVLQTPNFVYEPNCPTRRDLPAYIDVIRSVADQSEVPLIDHWQHWQARRPDAAGLLAWLQDQSIHPNYLGHREMASLICQAFGVFDPSSMTCSLSVS
jgi:lysophospholipase L1-like esterase